MKERYWYGLDRYVNPLGLGCWQLAGPHYVDGKPHGWSDISEGDARRLVHIALENGLQFFDTATGYGGGRSEAILGKALTESFGSRDAVICTKIALTDIEIKEQRLKDDFVRNVDASLARLKRERIDVLLLHNPPDQTDWSKFDSHILADLKKTGKIATFGISSRSLAGAIKAVEMRFGTCLEWIFNLLERRPIEQIFPKLETAKMNFIARSPLSRGLLSPKYLKETPVFDESDFRSTLPADWIEWVLESIRSVGLSDGEISKISIYALKFCLSYPEVSAVIPGASRPDHIFDYLRAFHEDENYNKFTTSIESATAKAFPKWS